MIFVCSMAHCRGNHEEIFIECEAHKARADHPDIDFSKHYAHEEV